MASAKTRDPAKQTAPALPKRLGRLLVGAGDVGAARLAWMTRSKADVGRWLVRPHVWIAVTDTHLLLLAKGPEPLVQSAALEDVAQSVYNPVTGELVLAGSAPPARRNLKMHPLDAQDVLNRILPADGSED